MPKKIDLPKHIIDQAFKLAAERGWNDLSLADIASAAKATLAELYAIYPSKTAILGAFMREVDRQVLAGTDSQAKESARDRLFDVLMRRLDALKPHRAGIEAVLRDARRDPFALLCGSRRLLRSMALMLEAAGISSTGPAGAFRANALAGIYVQTLRDWLADASTDSAPTMAALDRRLRRAERWAAWLPRRRSAQAA